MGMNDQIDLEDQGALQEYWAAIREEYMNDPLVPLLKTGLIHRTSIDGWKGIQSSGFIKPNSGEFLYTYEKSAEGYGASNGYVCLFDFESASEDDYSRMYHNWSPFFCDQRPATIILKLNRDALEEQLIPNSTPPNNCPKDGTFHLPYVEAWYPSTIPVSAILSCILVDCCSPDFPFEEYGADELPALNCKIDEIQRSAPPELEIPIMDDWA
jgi:hypothetical protein